MQDFDSATVLAGLFASETPRRTLRLKKGVADRYWEDLLMAMIGDQFAEAGEEVCGAVVSVRSGEDVFSIWTKNDGGRNVKIR